MWISAREWRAPPRHSMPDRQPSGGRRRPRLPGAVDVRGRVPVTSGSRRRVPVEMFKCHDARRNDGAAGGRRASHLPRPARRDRSQMLFLGTSFDRVWSAGFRRTASSGTRAWTATPRVAMTRYERRRPPPRPADCGLLGIGHGRRGCRPRGHYGIEKQRKRIASGAATETVGPSTGRCGFIPTRSCTTTT